MGEIQSVSCVRFQQIRWPTRDSIHIMKNGPFCAADLGRLANQGNGQAPLHGHHLCSTVRRQVTINA